MDTRDKILPRNKLREILEDHRRRGDQIVLANGCFDLLHVGHVRYLAAARREGDLLVVGINSDHGARQLKGPGRPILSEAARAGLVAAVSAVNYVVIFDEPTAEALLRDLRPHVHAKGTDYTPDTVPEKAVADELGVRVAIVGDPKNHSTQDLIARVRERGRG